MANNLNREIQENEVVIIDKKYIKPEYHADLRFRCEGGFGMKDYTMGGAIFGTFLSDGEHARSEGYKIDVDETERYQEEFGQFGERDERIK